MKCELDSKSAQWVVIVLIYLFVVNLSWSWAVGSLSLPLRYTRRNTADAVDAGLGRSMPLKSSQQGFMQRSALLNSLPIRSELHRNFYRAIVLGDPTKWALFLVRAVDCGSDGRLCSNAGDQGLS